MVKPMLADLSAETVRALFEYDPLTGLFFWRLNRGASARAGDLAGTKIGRGYISIKINQKHYLAHRLAWLYVHGTWPTEFLDHKDGDRSNNAFENLREVSRTQNNQNTNRQMGYAVVKDERYARKYKVTIWLNTKAKHIGYFHTAEEARAAYLAATQKYFGEFSVENRMDVGAGS